MSDLGFSVLLQERVQMNGILANAVEWGVKVLHVDGIIIIIIINTCFVIQVRCSFSISWCLMLDVQTDVISYVDKKKAKVIAVNPANPVVKGAVSIFVFLLFSTILLIQRTK